MDQSVGDCLQSLDIDDPDNFFASSSSINEEFKFLKRQYLKLCLKHHPDKGGDPERFREIQTSFECLRALFDKGKVQSFAAAASKDVSGAFDDAWAHFEGMATPSWDFYFDAEREPVPTYRVEAAKSGRAQCVATGKAKKCGDDASAAKKKEMKKGKKTKAVVLKSKGKEKDEASCIAKGELRCGWLNPESGSYGGWTHLKCWRVPSKIWLGLPDPVENKDENGFATAISSMNEVLLCGFNQLTKKQKKEFCKFVMDKSNWAKLVTKKGGVPQPSPKSTAKSHASSALSAAKSTKSTRSATKQKQSQSPTTTLATSAEIVPSKSKKKGRFVMPTPTSLTKNNLAGKTCVMTGIFPEVGGGAGLSLGKDRVKSMLQSFGAKVTTSISGKTDALIVGKEPGFSKVSKARASDKCQLLSLDQAADVCNGAQALGNVDPLAITGGFSAGYKAFNNGFQGNGLAIGASKKELAMARTGGALKIGGKKKRAAKVKAIGGTKTKPRKRRKKADVW